MGRVSCVLVLDKMGLGGSASGVSAGGGGGGKCRGVVVVCGGVGVLGIEGGGCRVRYG